MHNGTSQAPASFFLNLYSTREPTYRPDGDGQWGESELRRRLKELGEHRLTMLITTDGTRSWAIYLNEGLDEVLTYHGRALPGPKYSHQDDKDDLTNGILVRHLASQLFRTKIVKLDQSEGMAARIELADDSGHRYEVAVKGWRRMEIPPPGNEEVIAVDEIRGQSGRTWFVFEPSRSAGGRKLAVQADSASWTETA
jgi:hypothetical protein